MAYNFDYTHCADCNISRKDKSLPKFRLYWNGEARCECCYRERELEKTMAAMDAYALKHGEDALAKRMGLK